MQSKKFFTTRDLCYIAMMAAVIAVCALIAIPLPGGVPFTLQTWAILLAGIVLGPTKGVIAVLVYILLGLAGVPIFHAGRSGLEMLSGPTGGFIIAFPVLALAAGLFRKKKVYILAAAMVAATIVHLSFGMLWFVIILDSNFAAAFTATVAPFILPDIFKIIAAIIIGKRIRVALSPASSQSDLAA
ncbi:MAG: biotin transporter BioY [Defluviitaleaceae bacterium]|nr:biotin transporter BioY [Defluviitaleaceae bacterium]